MKNSMKIGIGVFILGLGMVLNSCVKDKPDVPPESTIPFDPEKILTIQDIKTIKDTTGIYTFDDIYSVYAVVGMDEKSGNIYKSAYVQDETGGIQMNFLNAGGLYQGDSIRIMLQGGTVDDYGGLYQINNLDVGRSIVKLATGKDPVPMLVTIGDLNADLDKYQSMVIQLDSVQFIDEDLGRTYADSAIQETGEVFLEDCYDGSILVRTSGYANFANHTLAEGKGTMIAISTRYNTTAQLVIREVSEIDLYGTRCGGGIGPGPIEPVAEVDEAFDNAADYTDYTQVGWSNFIVAGNRKWQGKTFNTEKYVQSTGYNSGLADMETWLITPPVINTNGDKKLLFKSAMAFWAHTANDPITVLASTDFDGTNFETASWTPISAELANSSSGDNNWIPSGEVSLESFVGNVSIAFKYKGSNSESTSIRIDDVVISGSGGSGITPVESVNEPFDNAEDYTDYAQDGWANIAVAGDRRWQGKTFNTEKYVQSTGYNSGLTDMETWLITPLVINTNGDKKLNFRSAMAYWAHTTNDPITVLASTDYDGTNFETANWVTLSAELANASSGDNNWVESGEVSLANFTGNVAIAFKYKGSGTESTSIRIDDVVIDGGGGTGGIDPVDSVEEYFDAVVDYEDVDLPGWSNIIVEGDRYWQGKEYSGNKYVQSTAYNSGLTDMESWLITPPVINTAGDKVLIFKNAQAYWAHTVNEPLTVLASTDYDGTNFETATWTALDPILAGSGNVNYEFIESGSISLAGFVGNVAIAFKYKGSDTESTSIQVDDVMITD